MGFGKPKIVGGNYRQHDPVEGWPTVLIQTYRKGEGNTFFQDQLRLKTPYVPIVGMSVQDIDGVYHKVKTVNVSYQIQSPPVFYVDCELPKSSSLNC